MDSPGALEVHLQVQLDSPGTPIYQAQSPFGPSQCTCKCNWTLLIPPIYQVQWHIMVLHVHLRVQVHLQMHLEAPPLSDAPPPPVAPASPDTPLMSDAPPVSDASLWSDAPPLPDAPPSPDVPPVPPARGSMSAAAAATAEHQTTRAPRSRIDISCSRGRNCAQPQPPNCLRFPAWIHVS
jgi:hypothetical protein